MSVKILILGIILLFSIGLAYAHADEFEEAKAIIDANTSCSALTEAQLEMIGDYYMEQMHPGEAHELMHKMMGGEDSETVKSMHTQMAKSIYCGETTGMMSSGMMSMMGTSGTQSLMGSGMMGSYGMMGSSGMMNYGTAGYFGIPLYIWSFLYLLLVIGAVILVFVLIAKFSLDLKKQKKK